MEGETGKWGNGETGKDSSCCFSRYSALWGATPHCLILSHLPRNSTKNAVQHVIGFMLPAF
jgi:hypothetical protein